MQAMEIGAQAIALERHSRATAFDDFAAEGNEQCLDLSPLQCSRNQCGEQGVQPLAVLGVHGEHDSDLCYLQQIGHQETGIGLRVAGDSVCSVIERIPGLWLK